MGDRRPVAASNVHHVLEVDKPVKPSTEFDWSRSDSSSRLSVCGPRQAKDCPGHEALLWGGLDCGATHHANLEAEFRHR